ncbi:MAG: AzlC family ABC transporter permease [Ruminococcaceae bacterium]|nr:AzlC family ABC transporter permease [Oscillospiraceae bacterium]
MENKRKLFFSGIKDGIPIALGYLSVSFAFAISALKNGISGPGAILISATNLTSAGQLAGIEIIAACGTLVEMAITQFVINLRYMLMSLSLSQKADSSFTLLDRLLVSFGITDEVFAVASLKHRIYPPYMYGLVFTPFLGWVLGTFLGAFAGEILPDSLKSALGLAIYGMFIAIIIPPARKESGVLLSICVAVAVSLLIYYAPFIKITEGFSIIICAVIGAAIAAFVKPVKEDE